jgi:hypothetical protein
MNQYRYLLRFDEESCNGCVKRRPEHENEMRCVQGLHGCLYISFLGEDEAGS